ncbi:PocR ligand-binding domain-containing protein [Desulfovibrio inopinatus]|uniref:PocR ligand-binding domain-containing protein n=1 Tax=Desulfovibrio inopinatus TaxID=102109 RepID=UPI000426655D|nr:PocR ligand-binding domain-containing protein [Desulfovibrio inopinatus]
MSDSLGPKAHIPSDIVRKKYNFSDLINVEELQNLVEVNYAATGMPSGIIGVDTGEIYAGAGWQRICTHFHRAHPKTNALCIKSDTFILNKIQAGEPHAYKCANGLWDIGVPIFCFDQHIATYFLGQFFYDDEPVDLEFFSKQADQYSFDKKEYLDAVRSVPRFKREKVQEILRHNIAMSKFLSNLASRNMERQMELEHRKRTEIELVKLQNYLSNIINSMPSAIIGVDPAGNVTQWNNRAEQLTGIPQQKAINAEIETLLPSLSGIMQSITRAIETREKQFDLKRRFHSDGKTHHEDITVYPLIANGVEGAVIRIDDITERVNLEQMMIQSEKMMSIGGLAAGMAHEINNPLAAILGYTHNIRRRIFGSLNKNEVVAEECGISLDNIRQYIENRDILKMLDGIQESGERAATIINNMLSFSRKSEKKYGRYNLEQLLDDTLELLVIDYDFKKRYDFGKIKIIREYTADTPAVYCEGNEIKQVFLNLLKNASEAMADKHYSHASPCIILRVKQDDDMVLVEVEDNGPGMDETTMKRVLDPFFTTKPTGKGTGLGLSVSYFIINDQHNGTMTVDSAQGKWTRFSIRLPIITTEEL